jgi:hypothetical protein
VSTSVRESAPQNESSEKLKLKRGDYTRIIIPGVSFDAPGIYEWRIYEEDCLVAVYVGICTSAWHRLIGYEREVAEAINSADGRTVAVYLARTVQAGLRIEWVYLENVADELQRKQREQVITRRRREEARREGFEVLNDTYLEETAGSYDPWKKHPFFALYLPVKRLVGNAHRRPSAKDYSTINYYDEAETVGDFIKLCVARGTYTADRKHAPLRPHEAHKICTWDYTKRWISVGGLLWPDCPPFLVGKEKQEATR